MTREGWVVVDLGFGDAGKGSVVDFLVRDRGAELVVRFNGGAQAGHNVVTGDGRHHTFSQFCAGALAGAEGLLGPDFLLHPLGMAVEAQHLEEQGAADPWARTLVHRDARVISPYQQAAGRLREVLRGEGAHGTCGVGVGECVADSLDARTSGEEVLRAGDLGDAERCRTLLARQRERKRAELAGLGADDLGFFDDPALVERVIDAWRGVSQRLRLVDEDQVRQRLDRSGVVVFEGAQGVLIDQTWGFHPHTTWSDCTPAGALALGLDRTLHRLGVLRSYGVRHGPGPFPAEGGLDLCEDHNGSGGFQGRFRVGALDGVLLRYAVEVCGGIDGLALTCLDRVARGPAVTRYRDGDAVVQRLDPGRPDDLAHREHLGLWLRGVECVREEVDPVAFAAEASGVPVWLESHGPTAREKRWRGRPG